MGLIKPALVQIILARSCSLVIGLSEDHAKIIIQPPPLERSMIVDEGTLFPVSRYSPGNTSPLDQSLRGWSYHIGTSPTMAEMLSTSLECGRR